MTRRDVGACVAERLSRWGAQLTGALATPLLLIGIGQGDESLGRVHVCLPEDLPEERRLLAGVLRHVLRHVEEADGEGDNRHP
jgi:hypothetical protein